MQAPFMCEDEMPKDIPDTASGSLSEDWKKDNGPFVFRKATKEETGNNRPVGLASIPANVMEQINLCLLHLGYSFCLYCHDTFWEILGPVIQVGYFAVEVSLLENYCPRAVTVCLRRCGSSIKAGPSPHSLIHSSRLHLLGKKVHVQPQDMSCYNRCQPCLPCQPCGPTPLANSCNEPCVRQCQDSHVVIEPSPVVVTLPGPILSSFPQNTAVGSSTSAAVGSILSSEGVPINSGGFGLGGFGLGGFGSGYCGRRCFPC
ncbi:uncharacterized protein [Nyctibius grandis]|uniref:uncharacterized protein n=2 Tax=Nyctibius grandis TaxID=48427 RepID=UPI0035BBC7C9